MLLGLQQVHAAGMSCGPLSPETVFLSSCSHAALAVAPALPGSLGVDSALPAAEDEVSLAELTAQWRCWQVHLQSRAVCSRHIAFSLSWCIKSVFIFGSVMRWLIVTCISHITLQ